MQLYKIEYEGKANEDIAKSENWYNNQKEGLGDEFYAEIKETINKYLTTFPKFATIYKNYRQITLKKFQHSIIYFIDEQKHEVIIIAVQHHKQNPETWKQRV
jgi:plasmid stabilization system protein ParE